MATDLPIEVTRGDTHRHIFNWPQTDQNGDPVDISTWTALELAVTSIEEPPDATTLLEVMVGAPLAGHPTKVYFVPSGTLAPGDYYYDAQGLNSDGEKKTFARGVYNVTQDRGKS